MKYDEIDYMIIKLFKPTDLFPDLHSVHEPGFDGRDQHHLDGPLPLQRLLGPGLIHKKYQVQRTKQ